MPPMMFISYRKADSQAVVDDLAACLKREFGDDNVFKDDSDIQAGDDWPDMLKQALANCQVLLTVVGPDWLTAAYANGKRRLDDRKDWVRREISTALTEGKRVIVLLAGSAPMPAAKDLPPPLRKLPEKQGLPLRPGCDREADLRKLFEELRSFFRTAPATSPAPPPAPPSSPPAPPPPGASVSINVTLSGADLTQLVELLGRVFNLSELKELAQAKLTLNLAARAPSVQEAASELVAYANAHGRVGEFLTIALASRPENEELRLFAARLQGDSKAAQARVQILTPDNPFGGSGEIVSGPRFRGRQRELHELLDRVVLGADPGNVAVVGEPRIGKSSLAWQALVANRVALAECRVLSVWLYLAGIKTPLDFYTALVKSCHEQLLEQGWMTPADEDAYRALLQSRELVRSRPDDWGDFLHAMRRYFRGLKYGRVRVVGVLDEFDSIPLIFRNNGDYFAQFRELSYTPDMKITWVTTSRRSIHYLETRIDNVSTLDGVTTKIYLRSFREEEMGSYYDALASVGVVAGAADRDAIREFTGYRPYLLDKVGYSLARQALASSPPLVRQVCEDLAPEFRRHYASILALLDAENNRDKLAQVLFGPVYDLRQEHLDQLEHYGWIVGDSGESRDLNFWPLRRDYRGFSGHFEDYFRGESRDLNFWPLWVQTEQRLRSLVRARLRDRFGENWLPGLRKAHLKLEDTLQRCEEWFRRDQKYPVDGGAAPGDLLDYTYPGDLWQIIVTDWGWFHQVLGRDKPAWATRMEALTCVRNPYAHSRSWAVRASDRNQAIGICQEILGLLDDFQAHLPTGTGE